MFSKQIFSQRIQLPFAHLLFLPTVTHIYTQTPAEDLMTGTFLTVCTFRGKSLRSLPFYFLLSTRCNTWAAQINYKKPQTSWRTLTVPKGILHKSVVSQICCNGSMLNELEGWVKKMNRQPILMSNWEKSVNKIVKELHLVPGWVLIL